MLCRFSVRKLLILANICMLFENFVGVRFFEPRCTLATCYYKVTSHASHKCGLLLHVSRVPWSGCPCVGVGHTGGLCKNGGSDRDSRFGRQTPVCPRNQVLMEVHVANTTEWSLYGGDAALCQMTLTTCNNYSTQTTLCCNVSVSL